MEARFRNNSEKRNDRISGHNRKRVLRKRRMRRMSARFITVLTLLLLLVLFAGSISSFAGSKDRASFSKEKYYSSVMIYPGDNLDSLSRKYISSGYSAPESLKKEIIHINHLDPEKALTAGSHIIIPVYR